MSENCLNAHEKSHVAIKLQGFPAGKLHGFQRNPIKNHDFHIFGVFSHIFPSVRSVRTRIATLSRVSSGPWRLDLGWRLWTALICVYGK